MTKRKEELRPDHRVTEFVDRESGAAEAQISPATWDKYVIDGKIPPPAPGFPEGTLRWYWPDVRDSLRGIKNTTAKPFDRSAAARAVAAAHGAGAKINDRDAA